MRTSKKYKRNKYYENNKRMINAKRTNHNTNIKYYYIQSKILNTQSLPLNLR